MLQAEEYDSDTSDEDFVPDGVVESDDEPVSGTDDIEEDVQSGDEDEEGTKGKKKSKKGKNVVTKKGKKKNPLLSHLNTNDDDDESPLQAEIPQDNKVHETKADSLWAEFLADTDEKPTPPKKPKSSSWSALLGGKKKAASSNESSTTLSESPKPSTTSSLPTTSISQSSTVKVTKIFEFAGEDVRVEEEVDANSAEGKAALSTNTQNVNGKDDNTQLPGSTKRPAGLSSILGTLNNKKQKLSTIEKTHLDWKRFKSDEGLVDELELHKKSKDGFLEKKAFLERADIRQFEIERSLRMGTKRSNR